MKRKRAGKAFRPRSSRSSGAAATFARCLALFGRKKLVDLVALMGNYASTAALLTAFDMRLDPGIEPPLPPLR